MASFTFTARNSRTCTEVDRVFTLIGYCYNEVTSSAVARVASCSAGASATIKTTDQRLSEYQTPEQFSIIFGPSLISCRSNRQHIDSVRKEHETWDLPTGNGFESRRETQHEETTRKSWWGS